MCLHFELTETAIIDLRPDILQQFGHIRDLGVQIGLDDFGTGYASLTHLRRLPVTFVKIDQSFIQGLGVDQEDERIVAAVVDLAANLGLRSIAEGVETPDQLRTSTRARLRPSPGLPVRPAFAPRRRLDSYPPLGLVTAPHHSPPARPDGDPDAKSGVSTPV